MKATELSINELIPSQKSPCHHYSDFTIFHWISLIIEGSIGLRSCSRVIKITMNILNLTSSVPSWYSGRLWLMRLGYFKLTRPKEKASDWVWIVDHSIQMGTKKCFVILGIRLSEMPIGRALTYKDMEPIELLPVEHSNGAIVYEQLKSAKEKTGIPREIIADKGADIQLGIKLFCADHPQTSSIHDMKHGMAILLKKELESNSSWENFTKQCKLSKQQLYQTDFACLVPPNQRSKARYMNVEPLIRWGNKVLGFLKKEENEIALSGNVNSLKEKLCWLKDYVLQLEEWSHIMAIISCTEDFIRTKGIYKEAPVDLENKLDTLKEKNEPFKKKVVDFVKTQASHAKLGETLLGSSEIIESLFGKQKNIQKEQSKSGFTGLLLSLAALVSKTTIETIQQAIASVKTKAVNEWQKQNIGETVQAKRITILGTLDGSEQKQSQDLMGLIG